MRFHACPHIVPSNRQNYHEMKLIITLSLLFLFLSYASSQSCVHLSPNIELFIVRGRKDTKVLSVVFKSFQTQFVPSWLAIGYTLRHTESSFGNDLTDIDENQYYDQVMVIKTMSQDARVYELARFDNTSAMVPLFEPLSVNDTFHGRVSRSNKLKWSIEINLIHPAALSFHVQTGKKIPKGSSLQVTIFGGQVSYDIWWPSTVTEFRSPMFQFSSSMMLTAREPTYNCQNDHVLESNQKSSFSHQLYPLWAFRFGHSFSVSVIGLLFSMVYFIVIICLRKRKLLQSRLFVPYISTASLFLDTTLRVICAVMLGSDVETRNTFNYSNTRSEHSSLSDVIRYFGICSELLRCATMILYARM